MIYTTDIIGSQWEIFLKATWLGVLLGGCYDVLRNFRTLIRFKKTAFMVSDFLYCIWAAFLIFSFLLNENFGIPRFYIFLGTAVGFFAWYRTAGKINMFFAKKLRRFLKAVLSPFYKIFRKILEYMGKRLNEAKIFKQKPLDKSKRLLKKKSGMVYNILCLNIYKAFSFCGKKPERSPEKVESNGTEKT